MQLPKADLQHVVTDTQNSKQAAFASFISRHQKGIWGQAIFDTKCLLALLQETVPCEANVDTVHVHIAILRILCPGVAH